MYRSFHDRKLGIIVTYRLQYAIEAWGNSNSLHKLQRVQKHAIRVIDNFKPQLCQNLEQIRYNLSTI